jgi:putative ABC transport system permease protein
MVAATSEDDLAQAESEVVSILRQRHKLTDDQENDFTVRNLAELVQTQQKSSRHRPVCCATSRQSRCWWAASAS